MSKKKKITSDLLLDIENYMEDQYTIEEMVKELKIDSSILKDERVINAIEYGRVRLVTSYDKYCESIEELGITENEYKSLRVKARPLIDEIEDKKVSRVEYAVNPSKACVNDFISRNVIQDTDGKLLYKEMKNIMKEVSTGKYNYLIETLMSNIILMQTRVTNLNQNITRSDVSSEFIEKQTSIQIKMMEEIRKTTLTIQQLVEPKKTVFVKGDSINQQNNQINFQKNLEIENEQSYEEIEDAKLLERGTQEETIPSYSQMETMGKINGTKE